MEENPKPRRRWYRFSLQILGSLVVSAIIAGACIGFIAAQSALQAERSLHSTLFVIKIVERFVATHHRWPQSWEELEGEPIHDIKLPGHNESDWPHVSPIVRQEVNVDFAADPAEITAQDPTQFTAILPIEPSFEFRDYPELKSLQETCGR